MIDCQDRPGEAFSLKYIGEKKYRNGAGWASIVMDTMCELKDIFVPLTADMLLFCYYKNNGLEDWDIEPFQPAWHLRELNIPENIYVAPGFNQKIAPTVINEVQKLDEASVVTWVENALKQESPRPELDIVDVDSLNFRTARARIINEKPFKKRDTFIVDHFRMGRYEYPLKRINSELWAYSPLAETCTKPSFYVRTGPYWGTFKLEIYWDWWTRTSPKDKDALEQALMNLLNKGQWKLDFIVKYLEMPKLRSLAEQLNKLSIPKEQLNTEKTALNGKTEPIPKPEPQVPESPPLEQQRQEKPEKLELVKARLSQIDREMKRLNDRIKNLSGGSYDRAIHTRIKELKAKISKLIGEKNQLEREKANLESEIERINQDIN